MFEKKFIKSEKQGPLLFVLRYIKNKKANMPYMYASFIIATK